MQLHADWAVTMGCGDACPLRPARASRTGTSRPAITDARRPVQVHPATKSWKRCSPDRTDRLPEIRSDPTCPPDASRTTLPASRRFVVRTPEADLATRLRKERRPDVAHRRRGCLAAAAAASRRRLAAFALVFAGCGAIVTDTAQYDGALGAVGSRPRLRADHHGDGLRDRPPLGGAHQPGRHDRVHRSLATSRDGMPSPTSPPSSPARLPARFCCSRSGPTSRPDLGATVPTVGAGQRVRLRDRAHRVPDVRDHGRGHRHARGRRRLRRSPSAAPSGSTRSSADR